MVIDLAAALLAHDRQDGASDVQRAEEVRLHLRPELLRADLLEIARIEIAGIVDEYVDAAESVDRRLCGCDRGVRVGDIQRNGQQVVMLADRLLHPVRIAAGCNDGVPRGQGRCAISTAHTAAGAGDEPNFVVGHKICFLFVVMVTPRRRGVWPDAADRGGVCAKAAWPQVLGLVEERQPTPIYRTPE